MFLASPTEVSLASHTEVSLASSLIFLRLGRPPLMKAKTRRPKYCGVGKGRKWESWLEGTLFIVRIQFPSTIRKCQVKKFKRGIVLSEQRLHHWVIRWVGVNAPVRDAPLIEWTEQFSARYSTLYCTVPFSGFNLGWLASLPGGQVPDFSPLCLCHQMQNRNWRASNVFPSVSV